MRMPRSNRLMREIVTLRYSLRTLDHSLRRLAPLLSGAVAMNGAPKVNGRSRPRFSAKARASLVLQGRYMGFMRQLKPRQKGQVRSIREVKGVKAAIKKAMEMASA